MIKYIVSMSSCSYLSAYEDGTDSVPKRRHIKFRSRGITQKKGVEFCAYLPMKMEQTEYSETSAYKIQTPGNYPEENIQNNVCFGHDEERRS